MVEAQDRAQARVGAVLRDKWHLDRLLGVGGMAAVYAATHRNKKRGAVKLLHPELSNDPGVRQRFLREGYVANSVGHRGAVIVDDDDVADDGSAFLVMELLEGETLDARCERSGNRLPVGDVLSLADQLLDTLAAAHTKGIVHRDLKPENLFLTNDGVLKVLDFGIARLVELSNTTSATQTGSVLGTPAFMAPEQARGRWDDVDGQTDLWAVGATMFTLLTGRYVHEAGTVNEALALAITRPAPSLATIEPDAHPALVDLVDRALAYDKGARWTDAITMQAALRHAYHAIHGAPDADASQPASAEGFLPTGPPTGGVPIGPPIDTAQVDPGAAAHGNARPPTITTARGVSASAPPALAARPARANRTLIAAAAVLLGALGLLVGVAGALALRSSRAPSAAPELPHAAVQTPAAPPRATVEPPPPAAPAPNVSLAPDPAASTAPASPSVASARKPSLRPVPAVKPQKPIGARPTTAPPKKADPYGKQK